MARPDNERAPTSVAEWERDVRQPALSRTPERADLSPSARLSSGVFTPESVERVDYETDIGDPGQYPYRRGLHATGYRGKLWTMRQFAGYGTPEDTNARYRLLLAQGGTGLSVAFDLPTLMGRDPDDPLSAGEVGRCGVSVASIADMETLFDGIPLGEVSTSMTINSPAPILLAMYLVVAERRGIPWGALSGTLQNDILKEFIAEKEFIFPPRPSMRFATDCVRFAAREVPRWNSVSVSGYHIREAGSTALQELAFTIADGLEYAAWAVRAGSSIEDIAPRLSFFFNAESDFFEEIAKFRAARVLWARLMRERFGATSARACQLRFHAQTSGATLTVQQPYNNVVRTAIQALSAVLGGANSLHTNALDEAYALPTAGAATLALRTQQILAHETGVTDVVDPFGGSWLVERRTEELVEEAMAVVEHIDALGGMVRAIEQGFPQREIAEASYRTQRAIESRERLVVGVNVHVGTDATTIPTLGIDDEAERGQAGRVAAVRAERDGRRAARTLEDLRQAAAADGDSMEAVLECVRASATLGEMCGVLRQVWGEHIEVPAF
jgi:methylmalonyl-CoA mutase N-terminal domain/subunit